jgi:hypothetical protein
VEAVIALPADAANQLMLTLAAQLIREFAQRSPISVVVPYAEVVTQRWPSTFRFTLDRRFIATEEPAPSALQRSNRALDSLRLALGVRLNRVYVPISEAYRTASYHLEIEGRQGTYFADGELQPPALEGRERLLLGAYQSQPRRGQRRSHLYLRNVDGKPGAYYLARFFERAPGSFAGTTIVALVSTVLIGALWLVETRAMGAASDARTLLPALLALPVAVAAFIGLEREASSRHPSLASRFVGIATAFLSLAGFVLAVVPTPNWASEWRAWETLIWLSVAVTLVSAVSWALRLIVENRFIRNTAEKHAAH